MARAFHFGDSRRPLFGVYHAAGLRASRAAILLCNPFGEEAIRSFRIFRLLAERLAAEGSPTLRFDYAATGDSAGACEEASLAGFIGSVLAADEELMDMSGASRRCWLGLRLGASVCGLAAGRASAGLQGLVLWDPVVSGPAYLRELAAGHAAAIAAQLGKAPSPAEEPREALGFAVPPAFAAELRDLNLNAIAKAPPRALVIAGRDPPTDPALQPALLKAGAEVDWRTDPGDVSWNSDKALNAFAVPARTLDLLVEAARTW